MWLRSEVGSFVMGSEWGSSPSNVSGREDIFRSSLYVVMGRLKSENAELSKRF